MSFTNLKWSTEPLRILALDPGTDTMGVAFFELCFESKKIHLTYATTYSADRYANLEGSAWAALGNRLAKLQWHDENLTKLLHQWRPHVVASEAPFMGRFPQAYAALVQCCNVISNAVYWYDPSQFVWFVDPPTAKGAVGALVRKGSKENVQESVRSLKDLDVLVDLTTLDEHAYDAVAVGYWASKLIQCQL